MSETSLPPLNWLRAFEAAARTLSFTAAAQELHMTQPAVSQQVKALENHLGRALFVRRTRSLQLTEAGRIYLPTVQEAFETLGKGTRMLIGGDRGRVLTIHCNLAFSVLWLAPRLAGLYDRHPWMVLNIVTMVWDPKSFAPAADVEIRYGRATDDPPGSVRLGEDRCYCVASPDLEIAGEDWSRHALFDCAGIESNWEYWLAARREKLPRGRVINLATTYSVSIMAAANGAGLALAHDTLADALIDKGRLVKPFDTEVPLLEAYFLIPAATHNQTPASRAFEAWVLRQFQTD
ncbi:LysR family transcriptional regulator [Hoeflea sp.]|uniref:LysR family transcriptional regulator n=1 Tax=Hoeflea sp. TaxID=1940281 RepID=UPI003B010489